MATSKKQSIHQKFIGRLQKQPKIKLERIINYENNYNYRKYSLCIHCSSGAASGNRKEYSQILTFAEISERLTQSLINNRTIQSDNRELYRYGIQQGLTMILNLATTLLIGVLCGMLWQSIVFYIYSIAKLRQRLSR